ncbi:hypothetical protein [Methylobacterium sp. CM6244]
MTLLFSVRRHGENAQHDHVHVLDMAGRTFMDDTVNVSMDAIVRRDDVDNASLYRPPVRFLKETPTSSVPASSYE